MMILNLTSKEVLSLLTDDYLKADFIKAAEEVKKSCAADFPVLFSENKLTCRIYLENNRKRAVVTQVKFNAKGAEGRCIEIIAAHFNILSGEFTSITNYMTRQSYQGTSMYDASAVCIGTLTTVAQAVADKINGEDF